MPSHHNFFLEICARYNITDSATINRYWQCMYHNGMINTQFTFNLRGDVFKEIVNLLGEFYSPLGYNVECKHISTKTHSEDNPCYNGCTHNSYDCDNVGMNTTIYNKKYRVTLIPKPTVAELTTAFDATGNILPIDVISNIGSYI